MNFFDPKCQEPPINNTLFGLCDDQDGGKAYTNISNPETWIATVKNSERKNLVFTAIDKCVIKDNENPGRGRCDGMITSDVHLYLIELKEVTPPWQSGSIDQLISTILFLKETHDIRNYKHKKAFGCNKKRGKFQVIDNEFNRSFYKQYGFRIDLQSEIVII